MLPPASDSSGRNVALYLVSALTLLRALLGGAAAATLWFVAGPLAGLAAVYAALLLRGPFDSRPRSAS